MSADRQRQLTLLCLAIVYIVWGTSYLATRIGVTSSPPLLFGGLRFAISGILMLLFAAWRGAALAPVIASWRHVLVMAILGVALCNGLQNWAFQWVPSNTGALLNASSALWIVVFGLFGARADRPSGTAILGLSVGLVGTLMLLWPTASSGIGPMTTATAVSINNVAMPAAFGGSLLLPQLAVILACIVWSLGTIYMRNAAGHLDLFAFSGAQMLVGGLFMMAFGLWRGEAADWQHSTAGWIAMAYLVIFSSCFAYSAYWWLARNASPAQVGTYAYVNPVLAALAGYVVLNERLSSLQIVGAAVILCGVLLINRKSLFA